MTRPTPNGDGMMETDAASIAESLNDLERDLLMGTTKGWGSWMFEVGADLCEKGLGRRSNGSIYLDTSLAGEVRRILTPTKDTPDDR